jgi:DNA processing protein
VGGRAPLTGGGGSRPSRTVEGAAAGGSRTPETTSGEAAPADEPDAGTVALLALRLLPGVGDRTARRLLAAWGTRTRLMRALEEGRLSAPEFAPQALSGRRVLAEARKIARAALRGGIRILGVDETAYPERLLRLHDPPAVLFLKGNARLLETPAIGIVGSRRSTAAGRRVAERIAGELSALGVTVVSGLAAGIDGAAHRGALGGPGGTIAVLGRGPDRAYPLDHADLFRRIGERGLLVSEFPPGVAARPHHFPRRNRVLAALGFGLVVVEARGRSGALLTVDHALDMDMEVMAVPGSPDSPPAEGTNRLIRDGASLVTSGREVLEVLGVVLCDPPERQVGTGRRIGALAEWQRSLFEDPARMLLEGRCAPGSEAWRAEADAATLRVAGCLGPAPMAVETLLERAGLPPSRTLAVLTRLELDGRARREPEGWVLAGDAA